MPDQFLVLRSSCSDLWVKDVASPSCNSLSTQPEPILVRTLYFLPQKNLNPSFCIKRYKLASTQKTCTLFIDKLVLAWIMKKSAYNEAFHVIFTSTLTQIARNEKTYVRSVSNIKKQTEENVIWLWCVATIICRPHASMKKVQIKHINKSHLSGLVGHLKINTNLHHHLSALR